MNEAPAKSSSPAFRLRVAILLVAGIFALSQVGRLNRYAIMQGVLRSHSPDPQMLHSLFKNAPDPAAAMRRVWDSEKLPHRWEIINYLNHNLGEQPELASVVGEIVNEAAFDPDLTLRLTALNLLRVIKHPNWQPAAIAALNDPDPAAQEAAHFVLQRSGVSTEAPAKHDIQEHLPRGPGFGHLAFSDFKQQPYPLSQFKGRPILLHFFATWSPDCTKEIPALIELRGMAPPELAIIGVNVDAVPGVKHQHSETEADHHECECCAEASGDLFKSVERHVILNRYNYPIVFDTDGLATAQLEGGELPVHVLLNKEHRLVRRYAGIRSAQSHDQIVRSLLGFKPSPAITNQLTKKQMDLSSSLQ